MVEEGVDEDRRDSRERDRCVGGGGVPDRHGGGDGEQDLGCGGGGDRESVGWGVRSSGELRVGREKMHGEGKGAFGGGRWARRSGVLEGGNEKIQREWGKVLGVTFLGGN
ncbi:hypothetical protein E2542_SST21089 [Spatholobus suberectus]|nr:hypothetical protein E2542_SST21089 [Spatholobus suberectus]